MKPLAMQPPFAARIDQLIDHQRLQHVSPTGSFARIGQSLGPERVQLQLLPQPTTDPARSPLARTSQAEVLQADLHPVLGGMVWNITTSRVQSQLRRAICGGVEDLDEFGPG